MTYELWDATSGNRLGGYASIDRAVRVAREMADLDGPGVLEELFIEAVDEARNEVEVVLDGPRLVQRVMGASAV